MDVNGSGSAAAAAPDPAARLMASPPSVSSSATPSSESHGSQGAVAAASGGVARGSLDAVSREELIVLVQKLNRQLKHADKRSSGARPLPPRLTDQLG